MCRRVIFKAITLCFNSGQDFVTNKLG
jgi:hypothetical protein